MVKNLQILILRLSYLPAIKLLYRICITLLSPSARRMPSLYSVSPLYLPLICLTLLHCQEGLSCSFHTSLCLPCCISGRFPCPFQKYIYISSVLQLPSQVQG